MKIMCNFINVDYDHDNIEKEKNITESIVYIKSLQLLFSNDNNNCGENDIFTNQTIDHLKLIWDDPSFQNIYKQRLNENLMVYDFLNIYEQYNETIYQDQIHINTKGNEIMASNLKDILMNSF